MRISIYQTGFAFPLLTPPLGTRSLWSQRASFQPHSLVSSLTSLVCSHIAPRTSSPTTLLLFWSFFIFPLFKVPSALSILSVIALFILPPSLPFSYSLFSFLSGEQLVCEQCWCRGATCCRGFNWCCTAGALWNSSPQSKLQHYVDAYGRSGQGGPGNLSLRKKKERVISYIYIYVCKHVFTYAKEMDKKYIWIMDIALLQGNSCPDGCSVSLEWIHHVLIVSLAVHRFVHLITSNLLTFFGMLFAHSVDLSL